MIVSKIIRCFILTFIFCTSVLYAQNIEFKKVNFKNDKSGLKDAKDRAAVILYMNENSDNPLPVQ